MGKAAQSRHEDDAITLLNEDHREVTGMFEEFAMLCDAGADSADKGALAGRICMALTLHAQVEVELFYPAVREAGVDPDLMDEALVEHATARELILQISAMSADDELYDAKVTVLGEYIEHHVDEEEGEMFPLVKSRARKAGLDLVLLGEQMAERKDELAGMYGSEAAPDDVDDDEPAARGRPAGGEALHHR